MMDVVQTTGRVIEATAKLGAAIILGVAAVVAAPYNAVNGGPPESRTTAVSPSS